MGINFWWSFISFFVSVLIKRVRAATEVYYKKKKENPNLPKDYERASAIDGQIFERSLGGNSSRETGYDSSV